LKWIKKLFGKKENRSEPVETFARKISSEEFPSWLNTGFEKLSQEISENSALVLKELEASLLEISENKLQLSEAKVVGDFDVRVVKRAKSNRENMIRQVEILVDKIKIPESKELKNLSEFHEKAAQQLNSCVENMARSLRYTGGVFPRETKELTDSLGKFGIILQKLQECFRVHAEEIDAYRTASETFELIRELSASKKHEEREIQQQKEKIRVFKAELKELQSASEAFEQSAEGQRYKKLKAELLEAETQSKKAKSNLSALLLPLSNNLERLKKLHESGRYTLKPEIRAELEACLKEPETLNFSFFEELKILFEDPALDLKAQKKEKALNQVEFAAQDFESRKKEYLKAFQILEKNKAELANLDLGALEQFQQKKLKLQSKSELAKEELEHSLKKMEILSPELETKKEELQKKVLLLDSKVKLDFIVNY